MSSKKLNRYDIISSSVLHKATVVCRFLTNAELNALREADKQAGRWCDDGGEPILYPTYKYVNEKSERDKLWLKIASKTGVEWRHWNKKPKFLMQCVDLHTGVVYFVSFGKRV